MRKRVRQGGFTVRSITGNHAHFLGLDPTDDVRAGRLGDAIPYNLWAAQRPADAPRMSALLSTRAGVTVTAPRPPSPRRLHRSSQPERRPALHQ